MDLMYGILLIACCVGWCEGFVKSETYIKDPAFNGLMCPAEQVEFQTGTRNAIDCVRACDKMPGCTSIVYLHDNKTCFGLKSGQPFNVSSPLPGAAFYKPRSYATSTTVDTSTTSSTVAMTPSTATTASPETSTPLTTSSTAQAITTLGPGTPMVLGLPDSQFTASGSYHSAWGPESARFSNNATTWCPAILDKNQWIQVNFFNEILATHVLTKGLNNKNQWVTSYTILTSTDTDCSIFSVITDDLGNAKVFPGNTDGDTAVEHALVPHVSCLCVRINPLTWNDAYIDLRLEVLGHVI